MIFLVSTPPPVHGMSSINQLVVDRYASQNRFRAVINMVPSRISKLWPGKIWVLLKCFYQVVVLFRIIFTLVIRGRLHSKLYHSISGGYGLIYDCIYACIYRLFRVDVYIHHHSFNYLHSSSRLFLLFVRYCLPRRSVHICLCPAMARQLRELYGQNLKVIVVSNSYFFDKKTVNTDKTIDSSFSIGILSNLEKAKGVSVYLDAVDIVDELMRSQSLEIQLSFVLAGPIKEQNAETRILDYVQQGKVEYLGPLYGKDKDDFYESLDVFVFPTHYANEAEPLVLYEAAEYGAYLISSDRGCIKDMINHIGGVVLSASPNANEVAEAIMSAIKGKVHHKKDVRKMKYAELVYERKRCLFNTIFNEQD